MHVHTHTHTFKTKLPLEQGQLDYGWSYFDTELEITVERGGTFKELK